MTLPEKRVLWYFLKDYKFGKHSTIALDTSISHREYARMYKLSSQQAAIEISKACYSLPDNTYYVPRPEWDGNVLTELDDKIFTTAELSKLKAFRKGNVVDSCDFGIERGVSKVTFAQGFIKHAIPLSNYFTQYRLYAADSLTVANHIALYEELQRWFDKKNNGGVYITNPTRLINKLGLPQTYEKYPQMRRGFITPALKSINEKTDLIVDLKEYRENPDNPRSKVTRLEFVITGERSDFDSL